MRLLKTQTYELEEIVGNLHRPEYAILSHTWDREEVSFQDHEQGNGATKQGWSKIQGSCQLAAKVGWQYIWIDCICIDKRSSAELSESINSMFSWYELASVCFVHLSDVDATSGDLGQQFRSSRWFRRGWTLQELLAPIFVYFYDKAWRPLGSRDDWMEYLPAITGIQTRHLSGSFMSCNIATKFGWASQRSTTREEDEAYCLLGIFGINMPLLYGEGRKPFTRLQLEIMKVSDDESIFAWGAGYPISGNGARILAPSPLHFNITNVELFGQVPGRTFQITKEGLNTTNWDVHAKVDTSDRPSVYVAPLKCATRHNGALRILALAVETQDIAAAPHEFSKTHICELVKPEEEFLSENAHYWDHQWQKLDLRQFLLRPTLRELTSQPIAPSHNYSVEFIGAPDVLVSATKLMQPGQKPIVTVPAGSARTLAARVELGSLCTNLSIMIDTRSRTPTISVIDADDFQKNPLALDDKQALVLPKKMGRITFTLRPTLAAYQFQEPSSGLMRSSRGLSAIFSRVVHASSMDHDTRMRLTLEPQSRFSKAGPFGFLGKKKRSYSAMS